jgi:dTDP-4-dehydrorhamnose 3,5-epimerase
VQFTETSLNGAYVVDIERRDDNRGYFARTFCKQEFSKYNLVSDVVQCNMAYNKSSGTLRGLHYQNYPHEEVKYVRCVVGKIFDVIVDLRTDSPTYLKWFGVVLSMKNARALYVPQGFAHGYLTLEDDSIIHYQTSEEYHPESERGIYYADETINIDWPASDKLIISDKDLQQPRVDAHWRSKNERRMSDMQRKVIS